MPRGSKAQKEAKRRVVAKGVVAGKSTAAIAREAKATKRHVERLAAEEETQLIVTELMKPHKARLVKLADDAITTVERALTADQQSRLERIAALTDRIERLRTVIEERAQDGRKHFAAVPGMKTGIVVHTQKSIGGGDFAEVVDEYEVDAGMLRELREHERQLREELNDFGPNLRAVGRARELLEMAEGTRSDGEESPARKFAGTMEELLGLYLKITAAESADGGRPDKAGKAR